MLTHKAGCVRHIPQSARGMWGDLLSDTLESFNNNPCLATLYSVFFHELSSMQPKSEEAVKETTARPWVRLFAGESLNGRPECVMTSYPKHYKQAGRAKDQSPNQAKGTT